MNGLRHVSRNLALRVASAAGRRLATVAAGLLIVVTLQGAEAVASPISAGPGQATVCSTAWLAGLRGLSHGLQPDMMPSLSPGPGLDITYEAPAAPAAPVARTNTVPEQALGTIWPNDVYFSTNQQNLKDLQLPEAWSVSYGGNDVTIAVIASGIDLGHEDLKEKVWHNLAETPNNGIDDDGNGYVDDTSGWDFAADYDSTDDNDPSDWAGGRWGTMASGIAAADTNNRIGIAGVSWGAKIMPLKVMFPWVTPDGEAPAAWSSDVTEAVCYAVHQGAGVILIEGWFFDTSGHEQDFIRMQEAINYAHLQGIVVVAPAGDCALPGDCGDQANPPMYPASLANVVGVQGATARTQHTPQRTLNEWASYGSWVDIVAPGEYLTTTVPRDENDPAKKYETVQTRFKGASGFGAAHVAGVAALLKSVDPGMTAWEFGCTICRTASRRDGGPYLEEGADGPGCGLRNDHWGCGFLNVQQAVLNVDWVVRITPKRLEITMDTDGAGPCRRLENAYLNKGMWQLQTDAGPWIVPGEVEQPVQGRPSYVDVCVDPEKLADERGGIQSGDSATGTLRACPLTSGNEACQNINLILRFFSDLQKLYLPWLGRPLP